MSLFIYIIGFTITFAMFWVGYELYRIRAHMDGHNARARRTLTRRRLSPQLFDQEA